VSSSVYFSSFCIHLSIYLSIFLSVCLSICLCTNESTYLSSIYASILSRTQSLSLCVCVRDSLLCPHFHSHPHPPWSLPRRQNIIVLSCYPHRRWDTGQMLWSLQCVSVACLRRTRRDPLRKPARAPHHCAAPTAASAQIAHYRALRVVAPLSRLPRLQLLHPRCWLHLAHTHRYDAKVPSGSESLNNARRKHLTMLPEF
jgi:hypothetical protein